MGRDFMADSATIIGESTRVVGSLSGDEDLNVFGTVEGTIRLTQALMVENSGLVRADVAVRSAVVSGVVIGNIVASEAVELTSGGRMVGDITAPRIIIADGAAFRGHVEMSDVELDNMSTPEPSSSRSSRAPSRTSSRRPVSFRGRSTAAAPVARPIPAKTRVEKPAPPKEAPKETPKAAPKETPAEPPNAEVSAETAVTTAAASTPAKPAPKAKAKAAPKKRSTRRKKTAES
jgi:cytoskeletal protein CcmA (bactofilin family)